MRIDQVPAVDVRGSLTAQRGRLLSLLASLSGAQWAAPTAAPQWSVKGIALHLLDGTSAGSPATAITTRRATFPRLPATKSSSTG